MRTIHDRFTLPSATGLHPLHLKIMGLQSPISVSEFELVEEMNRSFLVDITVTSTDKHIDSAACLKRPAVFKIEGPSAVPFAPGLIEPVHRVARTVHGIVTQWTRTRTTRDQATYRLHVQPRLALLEERSHLVQLRDLSLQDLLTEVIVDHDLFEFHDIEFVFDGLTSKFRYADVYGETVANFIDRHCRRAGVYYYFCHAGEDGWPRRDTLVFGNSPRGYMPALEVPLMQCSGLVSWHEAIFKLDVPGADARPQGQTTGEQTQIIGTSNVIGLQAGAIICVSNEAVPEAPYGVVITKMITTGGRGQSVINTFQAIPAHVTYCPR